MRARPVEISIHIHHHTESETAIMAALDNILREVQEAKDAHASAIALITEFRAKLDEMAAGAVELEALRAQIETLSADLSASTDALAAAVVTPPTP